MQRMNGRLAEATYATEAATAKGAALQERLHGAMAAIASLQTKAADRRAVDRKQTESLQAQYSYKFLVFAGDGSVDGRNLLARGTWGGLQRGSAQADGISAGKLSFSTLVLKSIVAAGHSAAIVHA